jgi:kinesin family protein 5
MGIDISLQQKLEAQFAAKRDAHLAEVQDLKQQLELRAQEIKSLNANIDGLKGVNEELKVRHQTQRYVINLTEI